MTSAFEKIKGFIMKSTGKEIRGKAQLCLPNPKFRARFKGLVGTGWNAEVLVGQVLIGELWNLAV